jgi:hypothetical protein
MLIRAVELRSSVNEFTRSYHKQKAQRFSLSVVEWKQLEYLIDLTKPFSFFTSSIGKTKGPTIQHVYGVYDQLFNHLAHCKKLLLQKKHRHTWIQSMIDAIDASNAKLYDHFTKTYKDLGSYYGIATLLAPEHKSDLFSAGSGSWIQGDGVDIMYELQLDRLFRRQYADQTMSTSLKPDSYQQVQHALDQDPLSTLLHSRKRKRTSDKRPDITEVNYYLEQRKL